MPFKWELGKNPYVFNYFGKLELGPTAKPGQIVTQARMRSQTANAQPGKLQLGGVVLDEHVIMEASGKLREPAALAEELLLVHPQTRRERDRLTKVVEELRQITAVPEYMQQVRLHHPLALLWLLLPPGAEAAELPVWSDLGLSEAGDEADQALDIVFDG